MSRFLMSAFVVALGLALAPSVQAGGRGVSHVSRPAAVGHGIHVNSWQGGIGIQRASWSHGYWNQRYGTYLYWNPTSSGYYYWCAPQSCYYPISYCPYGTYCWAQPVGGSLPAPLSGVPILQTPPPGSPTIP